MRPSSLGFVTFCGFAFTSALLAQSLPARSFYDCKVHLAVASQRSGLPAEKLLRVMETESAGNPLARSPRGAMGCMQIMPATWRELTMRYRLGNNPYDARTNMIGGALYLAELARQFGFPGAYSAYNAGPNRYQRHLAIGTPLPAETLAYTARIATGPKSSSGRGQFGRWQEAELFVARSSAKSDGAMAPLLRFGADRLEQDALFAIANAPDGADAGNR